MQTTQPDSQEEVIDFGNGQPGPSILPTELLETAAAHCFGKRDPNQLNYGDEQGDVSFLEGLAEFLTPRYGFPVQPEELFVTSGNSSAIDMVCAIFTKPGDTVFIEEPTYFLALNIFQVDYALNVVPIPVDDEGMSLEALEAALDHHQPKFVYTIPTYHNPTGTTLSQNRRKRLHQLAQENDFLIIADEVYQMIGFDESKKPPLAMAQYTAGNKVISLNSFSKIFAPGLRLGWAQMGPELMKRFVTFGKIASGGSANHVGSGIALSAIELGLQDKFLDGIKQIYKHRTDVMESGLRENLPESITWEKPDGGFFFWLTLPDSLSAKALASQAEAFRVSFVHGGQCSNIGGLDKKIRLSFSFYEDEAILEGCRRLGLLLKSHL